ncbi:MAG: 1-pyrroline-5-carboxylate dehydrogenase [Marinobacterium sp.]|nr:1-pyrroline-5-carboxylate dehydrogenase [Marinobacterium sp.]
MSLETTFQTLTDHALAQWESWDGLGVEARARILEQFAEGLHSAGSEYADCAAMVRWQIENARSQIGEQISLPGPTGEANVLSTAGRGLFVLAADDQAHRCAMVGQLATALLAGNVVIMLGHDNLAQQLAKAGCPQYVVQTLDSDALSSITTLPAELVSQPQLAGVAITSSSVAELNRQLAARAGNLAQLICETDTHGLSSITSPYYLLRFITERTRTDNTTAVGGNATLLELGAKAE